MSKVIDAIRAQGIVRGWEYHAAQSLRWAVAPHARSRPARGRSRATGAPPVTRPEPDASAPSSVPGTYAVAQLVRGGGGIGEREANARLIAAAPELAEALRALLAASDATLPAEWRRDRPVSLAKAALAKAEGRE